MRKAAVLIMMGCLCLTGCLAETVQGTPIPDDIPTDAPVPVVDYPDVYFSRYQFGFNLPEGWSAELHDEENTLILRKETYALLVGCWWENQPPPSFGESIPYEMMENAGTITLNSFWSGEIPLTKYRLVENNRVEMVAYGDEVEIGSLRLIIFLREESADSGEDQGIPAAIEAEADAIVQSYEEHGWEE